MTTKVTVTPELSLDEGRALARYLGKITFGHLAEFMPDMRDDCIVTAICKTRIAVIKAIEEAEGK